MEENFISNGSVFRGILRLPVRGAALAANRWSNRKSGGILDRRIAAANLDRAGKLVVYTAVFGGRDKLIEAPKFPNVEYVCFTDDQTLASRTWRIVQVPPNAIPDWRLKSIRSCPIASSRTMSKACGSTERMLPQSIPGISFFST